MGEKISNKERAINLVTRFLDEPRHDCWKVLEEMIAAELDSASEAATNIVHSVTVPTGVDAAQVAKQVEAHFGEGGPLAVQLYARDLSPRAAWREYAKAALSACINLDSSDTPQSESHLAETYADLMLDAEGRRFDTAPKPAKPKR